MFDYLINYGIKKHSMDYEDLDINDRMQLQEQINTVRRKYHDLLELLDEIQGKLIECTQLLSNRSKDIISEANGARANNLFATDDIYIELQAKETAFKSAISMINDQIDFCKTDLRILNSVFYNKF